MPTCRQYRRRLHHRRRGYTLVVFALIFFCLMALGALVIDLGLARLTQRQMQTAVNSAAVEGLRGRDFDSSDPTNVSGRSAARTIVEQTFDDDLDPASGDARIFGAGPIFHLGPGIGTDPALAAGQRLTIGAPLVYKPIPQLNQSNATHGDLVAGNYDSSQPHLEDADYDRGTEFVPAAGGDSFLARLRRTNDFAGLDNVSGISSAGPTLPFLFGRGSLIHKDPNGAYSPREHGITTRATAIAQARLAMAIGRRMPPAPAQLAGALPFVIEAGQWLAVASNTSQPLEIVGNEIQLSGQRAGYIYDLDAAEGLGQMFSLGQAAPADPLAGTLTGDVIFSAAGQRTADPSGPRLGYVALVGPVNGSAAGYVVAFGALELSSSSATILNYATLTKFVGPSNASSSLTRPLDANVFADQPNDPELQDLLAQHEIPLAPESPLLAPALVR